MEFLARLCKRLDQYWTILAALVLVGDVFLEYFIINRVPYTEIDWEAYMEEVEGPLLHNNYNYTELKGGTGPLVYPAGFVYLFSGLWYVTEFGKNIRIAQWIFAALHVYTLLVVFAIYKKSQTVPAWFLPAVVLVSHRVHSIFALRLFNDCWSAALAYTAIYLFLTDNWKLGCFIFSYAVSIKMSVLLFAPGLLLLLIQRHGIMKTIFPHLFICGALQVVLAVPFLVVDPVAYLTRAFELTRQFQYKWTVNLRFLDEGEFLDRRLHLALLALHVVVLLAFVVFRFTPKSKWNLHRANAPLPATYVTNVLVVSNFIGIVFARTLHYQFYVWYFHTLPILLFSTGGRTLTGALPKLLVLVAIEAAFNVFPARAWSSALLVAAHMVLLAACWGCERPLTIVDDAEASRKKKTQ